MNIPTIQPGRGLLLIGPQGAGKTRLALKIAQARGPYFTIEADDLQRPGLENVVLGAHTLMVDGLPTKPRAQEILKQLVTEKDWPVRIPSGKLVSIKPPAVIVCATEAPDDMLRHFDVVNVELAAA